ncbi:UDP-N-acetylglucosamine 2-epimerase (hydrolyzing) [Alteromonas sediminis]|uniref:UDP-N-acetylglucosamine 2-epimerase (Hydrolyzing) n=1 Tax=Alteromonas sediminis TaxID=2259342 RepID=A0A3N5Z4K1_9ALTE|nr:UDP-N-acetylglucosamine 2-epimerase [Alteromonas sediminis]RPJ64984.1 UDP-N-acetylglucosamine 2-epimerase (hydrolyzing) [Alteromonas sediminis]
MRKITFITGTRADFGKLKSLITILQNDPKYHVDVFATGMHLNTMYGGTIDEIHKSGIKNVFPYINHSSIEHMDRTLAKTVDGLSLFVETHQPDLIVVHGDRAEALAGSIVGSLNNILVAHIEGGEVSGTIDELIRHAVSKMSHIHFVANDEAKGRLIQLGEYEQAIHVIGSPDLDLMRPSNLPELGYVKRWYDIPFEHYAMAILHPVTTEHEQTREQARQFVDGLIESKKNYIVVYPNNDLGSNEIIDEYKRIKCHKNFRVFPSIRFEFFLKLLEQSEFIIGNSSCGIREAPYYNIPAIDLGNRQKNRCSLPSIHNCPCEANHMLEALKLLPVMRRNAQHATDKPFGTGDSDARFKTVLDSTSFWETGKQKYFQDLVG